MKGCGIQDIIKILNLTSNLKSSLLVFGHLRGGREGGERVHDECALATEMTCWVRVACVADICAGIKGPQAEAVACPAVEGAIHGAGIPSHATHGTGQPEEATGVNRYRKTSNLAPARRNTAGLGPLQKRGGGGLVGLKACAWTWEESRLKHSDAASLEAAPALPLHLARA